MWGCGVLTEIGGDTSSSLDLVLDLLMGEGLIATGCPVYITMCNMYNRACVWMSSCVIAARVCVCVYDMYVFMCV